MEFQTVLQKRCMCRAFRPDPLPERLIHKILRNAIRAPSAGHLQPWDFILVRDAEVKERLAHAALDQMFIAEAPLVIVTCADTERNAWRYGDRGRHFYSLIDVAFASLNILLTCTDEGLGACFVGAYDDAAVTRILRLPRHIRPVGLIPIGRCAEPPTRARRLSLSRLLHTDTW